MAVWPPYLIVKNVRLRFGWFVMFVTPPLMCPEARVVLQNIDPLTPIVNPVKNFFMSTLKTDRHRIRGFIRVSTRHGLKMQTEALGPHCGVVYHHDQGDGLADLLASLRRGDTVLVTSLARLTSSRDGIAEALRTIHAKKAAVVETSTNRRSDNGDDAWQMMADAVAELSGDSRALPSRLASRYGKLSGKTKRAARLAEAEAKREWFDVRNSTTTAALEKMPGWSLTSAYRKFGQRRVTVGRPRGKR